ncbi:MAG: RNA polymerase sigma factor [Gemmatimonadetes bacterium]|nr:RNA polymerase sigma factor [Gemmatimonadota bacterium]
MSGIDDARLVRRVLDGDRAAYRLLVQRHEDTLFRRARALLGGDGDLAADVVQDAFLRAYQKLATCSRPEAFGGWVYRAVRNRCYDELRAARRRGSDLSEVAGLASHHDPAADLERDHLRSLIRRALDALTPPLREAFVMKHVDGLSYDEMQDATGVARSALKMRVKRAREELETRLRPLVEGGADVTSEPASTSNRVEGG